MEPEMSESKPHPSEFLEFVTIGPQSNGRIQSQANVERGIGVPPVARGGNSREDFTRSNDDLFAGLSASIPNLRSLSADAKNAAKAEHRMTFLSGVKLYPKAMAWSFLLSTTIIMEGYDTTLINSFFAFPVFRRAYGTLDASNGFQISPSWQSGLASGATTGEIIGLFLNGIITDKIGYKKTMILSLVWLSVFVFLAFFGFNIRMLLASNILCGLPWGVFQTLSTTYAAEVMPVALRAYLTSSVNLCWLIGQVLGVGIINSLVHNQSQWAYRIPFGLQWAFALCILVGVFFAPESPWWLVRHDRPDEAKKALLRLTERGDQHDFDVDESVAMMTHTNAVEKHFNPNTSYLDCLKGADRRRTEIATMVWVTQALSGSALTGFAAYFYEQAGFKTEQSFNLAVGMYGLAIFGGLLSWIWMAKLGRRTLYLWGLAGCFVVLIITGVVGCLPATNATEKALGSLIIIMTFIYDSTLGPVCYTLVAEIPSTRLRVKTVVIARCVYNLVSLITNFLTPKMLNPTAWNWKAKSAFLYAGTSALCFVWCYFRLPEPKGLTYVELDILFEKRAKTKKFKEFQVNLASSGYFSVSEPDRRASGWRGYG